MNRLLRIAAAAALLTAMALFGLAATPIGARLAASAVERGSAPGLELQQPAGSLLGGLKIARIVHTAGDRQIVAEDVEVRWRPLGLADGVLLVERLSVGRLRVSGGASQRFEPPAALTLPMAVEVRKFNIADARVDAADGKPAFEANGVEGRFASDGRRHRVEALRLSTARLAVEASGALGGLAPFPLTADVRIAGKESGHAFVVQVKADGPLKALKLVARSASGPSRVDGEAVLDVFAHQPLIRGSVTAAGLDPAAWVKGAPHARLEIRAEFGPEPGGRGLRGALALNNVEPGRLDQGRLPLRRLQAEAHGDARGIVVPRFTASLAGGEATGAAAWADGELSLDASVSGVDAAAWQEAWPKTRLGGDVKLATRARLGAPGDGAPWLALHWSLRDSVIAGHALTGRGDVVLRGDTLERADVSLRAGANVIEARGRLGAPEDALTVAIDAPRLDQIGLGGQLRADVALSGRLRAPGARWKIDAPRFAVPGRVHAQSVSSEGRWDADGGGIVALGLTAAHLTFGGKTPPLAGLSVAIDGRRDAHRVKAAAKVGDEHAVSLSGEGGFLGGQIWRGRLDTFAWQGPRAAHLANSAELEIGAGRLAVSRAAVVGRDWQATVDGLRWEPGRLQSSGRFSGLPAGPLLPATAAATTLRLGGNWNLDFGARADGRVRVFRERGDVTLEAGAQALALGLDRLELAADFAGRQANVSLRATGVRAGTLSGRFTAALRQEEGRWTLARQAPWQGSLRLDTPSIAWLSPLAGEQVLLGGRLDADVDLGGTPAVPAAHGRVAADDLRVALLDHGLDLGGGVLRLDFTPETARLERLELVSAATQRPREGRIDFERLAARPGRLVAEGEIALQNGHGRIRLQADRLVLSELPDRWVMVSGKGGAQFADGELVLSGDAAVDAAYVELAPAGQPTLSADVVVLGRQEKERRFARLGLDLNVNLGERFYFQGAGMRSRLAGALHLAADRDVLRARGSVNTVEGTIDAYGRELAVERGILNFQGLADNPGLNVRALRKNQPVEAGVEVTGTLKNPKVRLVSVPDVPDTEKLSWMLLGRAPGEALGAEDADLLLSAAMALRGSQGKAPLQTLMQGLGLDELGISSGSLGDRGRFASTHVAGSFDAGGTTVAERIATVGKRIGANAVLSYEHSLTSAESIVKLTVELSRRVAIVGRVGADNAVGLVYSFAFGGGKP